MSIQRLPLLESPKQIIVRMPNWLGDLVMATPILTDLRHHWPEAKITAMCQGALGTVIQEDPHIDNLFNFHRSRGWFNRHTNEEIILPLKQGQFDLGILMTNSLSSSYWFWRGGVKHRVGYATHGRSLLLNHPIPPPPTLDRLHLVIAYKSLLEPLGIAISKSSPHLYLTKKEQTAAREKFAEKGIQNQDIVIGINPGAAYGSAKCWLPERFKQLSQHLIEDPCVKLVYFADKAGTPLVQDICAGFPTSQVVNLAGQTSLRQLMATIQSCDFFLTNDSGPMHVASALDVPLIALFGSTSDIATSPYKGGIVIHKHVPCSPCYRRQCPIDFRCMTRIEVREVYDNLLALIDKKKKKKEKSEKNLDLFL